MRRIDLRITTPQSLKGELTKGGSRNIKYEEKGYSKLASRKKGPSKSDFKNNHVCMRTKHTHRVKLKLGFMHSCIKILMIVTFKLQKFM